MLRETAEVRLNSEYFQLFHGSKSAAHLQFNSPMALYSTANAQEALDKDKEASELIQ